MSTSVETTAAMPPSTEPEVSAETAAPQPAAGTQAAAGASTLQGSGPARKPVSPNVIISTLVALFVAAMGMISTLLVLQFNSLGDRIDSLGTELRTEISGLRAEMQAGFHDINAILLDHTERLVRLESAVGLNE